MKQILLTLIILLFISCTQKNKEFTYFCSDIIDLSSCVCKDMNGETITCDTEVIRQNQLKEIEKFQKYLKKNKQKYLKNK